jgi:L-asparaginase II
MLQLVADIGVQRFPLADSGAAYGPELADMYVTPESHNGMPSPLNVLAQVLQRAVKDNDLQEYRQYCLKSLPL